MAATTRTSAAAATGSDPRKHPALTRRRESAPPPTRGAGPFASPASSDHPIESRRLILTPRAAHLHPWRGCKLPKIAHQVMWSTFSGARRRHPLIHIPPKKFPWHPAALQSLCRSRGFSGSPKRSRPKRPTDTAAAPDPPNQNLGALESMSRGTKPLLTLLTLCETYSFADSDYARRHGGNGGVDSSPRPPSPPRLRVGSGRYCVAVTVTEPVIPSCSWGMQW